MKAVEGVEQTFKENQGVVAERKFVFAQVQADLHLGSALVETGQREAGMARLSGAVMVPEVFRVRSIVLKALGDLAAAKACLERSIELARNVGTVLLELRASVDGEGVKDVVGAQRVLATTSAT